MKQTDARRWSIGTLRWRLQYWYWGIHYDIKWWWKKTTEAFLEKKIRQTRADRRHGS